MGSRTSVVWNMGLLVLLFMQSCGLYSFSGTSIPQEVKSFSVNYFENNAPINSPLLSQTITEGLKQKFISETNLSITEKDGDFDFSGVIYSHFKIFSNIHVLM